jgi:hypothetical protein
MIMTGKPHHHPFESTAIQKGKKKTRRKNTEQRKETATFFSFNTYVRPTIFNPP